MPVAASTVQAKKAVVYDSPKELDLICRAKLGDGDAFRALYETHRSRVAASVAKIVKDEEAAKDIVNEALTRMWSKLHTFKGNSKFATWVTRIAINLSLMHIRSGKRDHLVSLDDVLPGAEEDYKYAVSALETRDLELEGMADRQLIERAMERVPQKTRELLRLRLWEGMSLKEIQDKMRNEEEVSIPTLKSRLLRGRSLLKEQIARA